MTEVDKKTTLHLLFVCVCVCLQSWYWSIIVEEKPLPNELQVT